MNQKHKYLISTVLLFGVALFIALFDYITFFEKRYGLDKLDYQFTRNYFVYSEKMTPIKIIFSSIFFISLIAIVLNSLRTYKNRDKNGVPGYIIVATTIVTIGTFVLILLLGIFQTATVM